jgi:uncharacterized membrane protein YphA (DoxX/SURF4 family)
MRTQLLTTAQILIGCVWIFHGLYSKLLRGIPRHRAIVARVLGERHADLATNAIGLAEITLGIWTLTGWQRIPSSHVDDKDVVHSATGKREAGGWSLRAL